jgi:hypothetical protein
MGSAKMSGMPGRAGVGRAHLLRRDAQYRAGVADHARSPADEVHLAFLVGAQT